MAVLRRRAKKHVDEAEAKFNISTLVKFANEQGIQTVPMDLKALIKGLGLRLKYQVMDPEVSGYLKKNDRDEWVIGVNKLHHLNRKKFTIAHEIAHYCLHSDVMDSFEDTVMFRNGDSSPYETQANQFAAELLMPKESFLDFVNNKSTNVDKIAEYFGVSSMAVRIRAKDLGLGGHGIDR